jgi:two-component system, OmpR family, alkaline phosphatase synthesis response regulator PhoP
MTLPPGTPHTVLIVDDNEQLLASLSFALKALGGFRIEVATDGAAGLIKALDLQPDCMVIDVKMPEIDGLRLVRALRGDPETARIPLVLLSALVQPTDQALGMYAGADQYLTKPAKPHVVIEAIRRAIALTEEQRRRRLRALAEEGDERL